MTALYHSILRLFTRPTKKPRCRCGGPADVQTNGNQVMCARCYIARTYGERL